LIVGLLVDEQNANLVRLEKYETLTKFFSPLMPNRSTADGNCLLK